MSSKFIKVFNNLHKFLIFDVTNQANKSAVIEQSFLCANQIIVCLKFLEKTVDKEAETGGCLITARQCFFERILWCLARLKSTVKDANDHVLTGLGDQQNFVSLLDTALDILLAFVGLESSDKSPANKAERRAEMMMESREIKEIVEQLLSHTMAFSKIALESDKNPITALSQNVLRSAMEFEEEFSLADPNRKLSETAQRMKSIELESSLCSLENFVNNALLRLSVEVFHVMDGRVVQRLIEADESNLEAEVEKFDLLIDRLIVIGRFGISFSSDDAKVSSAIRSCLASIESLDSYLIPAITNNSDPSLEILQSHFEEEAKNLQALVQQIIETKAFCSILMEQIDAAIDANKKDFDRKSLENLVERSNVLLRHFNINSQTLQLFEDKVTKFYFNGFKLILTECDAILNFPDSIDDAEKRILKRFRILYCTIKKLQNALKNLQKISFEEDLKVSNFDDVARVSELPSKASDYFNTIRPSALGSILYESKRSIKIPVKLSKFINATVRRSTKKRRSMRMTIFKKNHEAEVEKAFNDDEPESNETMDLQITEILEKLTDLSTTLSHKTC